MKKHDPKDESEIEKGAVMYSNPWKAENTVPNVIVVFSDVRALLNFLFSKAWWHQVTDTPEDNKRMVLRSGMLIGLNGLISLGAQDCPSSTVGEILLWKKAQKKAVKNNTSDAINRIIPVFSPFITRDEWFP
jgi:hypothetical protein